MASSTPTSTNPNADNWLEEPGKIPSMLNVLSILTFIGSGLGLLASIYGFFSASSTYDRVVQSQDKLDQMPDMFKKMMGPHPVESARLALENRLPILLLSVVSCCLCLYGAMQMRKLKKTGFSLYVLGDLLYYVMMYFFMGSDSLSGMGFIFGLLIVLLFIVLYATQLKYLK